MRHHILWKLRCSYYKYILVGVLIMVLSLRVYLKSLTSFANEWLRIDIADDSLTGHNSKKAITVAFVVTVTGCSDDFALLDGAAVLAYSIHQNSIHGTNGGRYDYDLYLFHHPNASVCSLPIAKLGYIVEERDTPVAIGDIRNEAFRSHIQSWGCCGERELIKFEAFTLTQYPAVALLDVDTLVLQPLDRLFDFIQNAAHVPDRDDLMYVGKPALFGMSTNVTIPDQVDLLYTSDYPMVEPTRRVKPTQGGFVVLRPNLKVYYDIIEIVKEGDYHFDGGGWGGRTGMFWGDTTFQGLIPYYFQILHSGNSLELNYCVWNNNNFSPFQEGQCATSQENCEDCRLRPIEEIGLLHYTLCLKPWYCYFHDSDDKLHNEKCAILIREWFKTRLALERSWGLSLKHTGTFYPEVSLGFCNDWGYGGYERLELPSFLSDKT